MNIRGPKVGAHRTGSKKQNFDFSETAPTILIEIQSFMATI
jgi:hypothetical protein